MQEENKRPMPVIAGNTATGTMKTIALASMMFDHMGKMLFPKIPEMRIVGRIAFPLYCWCMVTGFMYTRSVPKYLLRILITGLISQPLYVYALNHTWTEPNIFLTLFIGLMGLWGIREKKYGSHFWAPPLALVAAELLNANYGWRGVLFIFLLYAVRDSRKGIAAVMIGFCLFWGASSSTVSTLFGMELKPLFSLPGVGGILSAALRLQALSILAMPFILIPMKNYRMPTWLSYAIYPMHLVLLYILEKIFLH